ncbi:unnamed protein product [Oikopleura dioica]|uniref:Uncharacterized protein n=1 Tax=Oikopleura dioica TaxID=34765 RepID=E4Y1V2_OIKDI|nr:unnamed protein product [Oikopleura dioica]
MRAKLARRFILARPKIGFLRQRQFTFSIAAQSNSSALFTTEDYGKALSRLGLEGDLFYSKENLRNAFAEVNREVELDDVSVRDAYEYCFRFYEDMYGRSQGRVEEKIENVAKLKRSVGG